MFCIESPVKVSQQEERHKTERNPRKYKHRIMSKRNDCWVPDHGDERGKGKGGYYWEE
jgi:hypothetical protein